MPNHRHQLQTLTQILLEPVDRYDVLAKAISEFNQLFIAASGLDVNLATNRADIMLPNGKAIGPAWAAACVKELIRTKRFLRGVYLGIQAALRKFPIRPIHILYAGTGPFATLAIPLTTVFPSSEVQFTCLEIHPESIQYLKNVIAAFQAEDYIKNIIQADATQYQANSEMPFQMVITETMQSALQKEPQVAITLNLLPQLVEGGIFIPEQITIEAALMDPDKNKKRMTGEFIGEYYYPLGKIFELNRETALKFAQSIASLSSPQLFPAVEVEIPPNIEAGFSELTLFTHIQVYENERLTPWECSLTMPKGIKTVNREKSPVHKVRFQYRMDRTPGFEYQI